MTMLKADDFRVETKEISGWKVNITSYRIGNTGYCHIDNIDPGATIARTEAETQEEAVAAALARARERLIPKTR
ncbi:MAG: hypothetical protein HYR76_10965 [Ignavibacteria bacterium]|nr:hypothetical protein [Ignavibacteria bacterium]